MTASRVRALASGPRVDALRVAIRRLPSPDRDVAWRYFVEREHLAAIARSLRMTLEEAQSALSRAREDLAVHLKKVERG
ncbi:MAG: hypothetical protein ACT4PE_09135 [Candidatus Eiseniibacteriota bacterium]